MSSTSWADSDYQLSSFRSQLKSHVLISPVTINHIDNFTATSSYTISRSPQIEYFSWISIWVNIYRSKCEDPLYSRHMLSIWFSKFWTSCIKTNCYTRRFKYCLLYLLLTPMCRSWAALIILTIVTSVNRRVNRDSCYMREANQIGLQLIVNFAQPSRSAGEHMRATVRSLLW